MNSVTEFMSSARTPMQGNSPWASQYAAELRRVVTKHANHAPRNQQAHLGPSELGVTCDRQIVGKLAGIPRTNHIVDPWASIVGTAVHSWLAECFAAANTRAGVLRWVAENRVVPHPEHAGTADLYDAQEQTVVDHKVLGDTSMAKVKSAGGPPRKYVVQLLLYGIGYRNLGLPVNRIVLAAYPRTSHTLDGLYVWEREISPQDDALIKEVFEQTDARKRLAAEVTSRRMGFNDVPTSADSDECFFCPFYRPESARDGGPGCPGTTK
jgi:hypothetical protein